MMDKLNNLIISKLLKGCEVSQLFDYLPIVENLCERQAGQLAAAERAWLRHRESSGRGSEMRLSEDTKMVLRGLRYEAVNHLRAAAEQLEIIDTVMLMASCSRTDMPTTIDDVISVAIDNHLISYSADWAVVLMLCNENGVQMTATQLISALKESRIVTRDLLPSRVNLQGAITYYEESEYYPNWPQNTKKEARYAKIASVLHPIVTKMPK